MNETTANNYPEWQAKIREAQRMVEAEIATQNQTHDEAEREREMQRGIDLKRALAYYGIEAEPLANSWTMGDLRFSLASTASKLIFEKPDDQSSFTLQVSYALPREYMSDDPLDYSQNLSENVHTGWFTELSQLQLAQLTYAIDAVTERAEDHMKWAREQRKRSFTVPELPSIEMQLVSLIRQIVRDEMGYREEY